LEGEQQRAQKHDAGVPEQTPPEHEDERDVQQVDAQQRAVMTRKTEPAGGGGRGEPEIRHRAIETIAARDVEQPRPAERMPAIEPLEIVRGEVSTAQSGGYVHRGRRNQDRGERRGVASVHVRPYRNRMVIGCGT
jgi:hypothetical protein